MGLKKSGIRKYDKHPFVVQRKNQQYTVSLTKKWKEVVFMLLGYARVSTEDQNLDRQIDQLKDLGISMENIYSEKVTGTKKDRPILVKL